MQLKVKDIQKIWKDGCASLVAGKGGLERKVAIYDIMEQPDIKKWLREHLLLITTGYVIRNDREALLNLIRDLHEANAAALAIKTRFFDEFPKEALELADKLDFPVFFLNNDYSSTEIVFPVMVAIVEAKNRVELDTRYRMSRQNKPELDGKLFLELCTGKVTQEEEVDYRTNSLQWPQPPVRMLAIQAEDKTKQSFLLEMNRDEQVKAAGQIWNRYRIPCVVVCRKAQCICIFKDNQEMRTVEKIAGELVEKTQEIQKCSASALITDTVEDYLELREKCTAVEEGFYVREVEKKDWTVNHLKNLQYERIMLHTAQQEETKAFVREKLGGLEQYDREHDGHLMQTLEILIANNGSRKLTAETLFLHRNTMSYRVRKIEEVLGCNLEDMDELKQLRFACKARKYV